MKESTLTLLLVCLILAPEAAALDMAIEYSVVPEVDPALEAEGYRVNDVMVTTDTDWLGSQLVIALSAGHIYNEDAFGDILPPIPVVFPVLPNLEWDSWVAADAHPAGRDLWVYIDGAAIDFPDPDGNRTNTVGRLGTDNTDEGTTSPQIADVAWSLRAWTDIRELHQARITMSPDAVGNWAMRVSARGDPNVVIWPSGPVIGGRMIPEPGSWILVLSGALGLLALRRP